MDKQLNLLNLGGDKEADPLIYKIDFFYYRVEVYSAIFS
jgi:hypothetical protein